MKLSRTSTHPKSDYIFNTIYIRNKDYVCKDHKISDGVLYLRSNTYCKFDCTLSLAPCSISNYQIVQIYDVEDVKLRGGSIEGDVIECTYTEVLNHE